MVVYGFSVLGCTRNPVVAEVGSLQIHRQDVNQRNQVIHFYFPQETREMGLEQLVSAYTTAQVLINNGQVISVQTLEDEAQRIDQNSLMPDKLQQIKAIFAKDHLAYLRVYVLPTYAERIIYYGFFLNNAQIQAHSLKQAQEFLHRVEGDQTKFAEIAADHHYPTQGVTLSRQTGLQFGVGDESPPTSDVPSEIQNKLKKEQLIETERWRHEIIATTHPGHLYNKVIDHGEAWMIVRYLGVSGPHHDQHKFMAAFLPKEDFNTWFTAERKKVRTRTF
jgi:hypothetical protein